MKLNRFILLMALGTMLPAAPAPADDSGINAQLFRPSIFGGAFVAIEDSQTLCTLGFGGGLLLDYANSPLVFVVEDEPEFDFISELYTTHITLGIGIWDFVSLGTEIPLHVYARKRSIEDIDDVSGIEELKGGFEFGDIRAELKFRALQQEYHYIGLALAPYATFPTGDSEGFLGEGRITGGGTLILERDFEYVNLGLNGGYQYRGKEEAFQTEVGDAYRWGAGISSQYWEEDLGISFSVEYFATWFDVDDTDMLKNNPMEVLASFRYRFGSGGPRVLGGGGAGITDSVGSPAYRVFAGADWFITSFCYEPPPILDTDGDGIMDPDDNCITLAEDFDDFHDKDGCPDNDNDVDGVHDDEDDCPNTPGIPELKGCPDQDTDGDTVLDLQDECPQVPGLVDNKGCPVYEEVQVTEEVIEISHMILFRTGSAEIMPESYNTLNEVAQAIRDHDIKMVQIEGHTDWTGNNEYNMRLSQNRADSVMKYLIRVGIEPERLVAVGFGEERPVDDNRTEHGREVNRRVVFHVLQH